MPPLPAWVGARAPPAAPARSGPLRSPRPRARPPHASRAALHEAVRVCVCVSACMRVCVCVCVTRHASVTPPVRGTCAGRTQRGAAAGWCPSSRGAARAS
eukprot:106419-Prymnesium_polylepis.1